MDEGESQEVAVSITLNTAQAKGLPGPSRGFVRDKVHSNGFQPAPHIFGS